jgi:dCTP deaminase
MDKTKRQCMTSGILPCQTIQSLFDQGVIIADKPLDDNQIQPASLDLRLGRRAWRIRASFLPSEKNDVKQRLNDLALHEISLENGAVLETGCVYLVPLLESFNLPDTIAASANPKSSTGRLDVFTRVIAEKTHGFDQVPRGYKGNLYLEIAPRTFPVLVRTGSRLSQIRFRQGDQSDILVSDKALAVIHNVTPIVSGENPRFAGGVNLSIDLEGPGRDALIGYRAKRHTGVVDVDKKAACDVRDYWEPIEKPKSHGLILDPGEFYILVSQEAVQIPPDYAAEMVPFDPLVGEFRVHYAGFFDPGFGHASANGSGSRAVLEVRSREVPFILEHGQTVGRLVYEHMTEKPDTLYGSGLGSNYQGQLLKLSKHFKAHDGNY